MPRKMPQRKSTNTTESNYIDRNNYFHNEIEGWNLIQYNVLLQLHIPFLPTSDSNPLIGGHMSKIPLPLHTPATYWTHLLPSIHTAHT